jgi:hypothetical protein
MKLTFGIMTTYDNIFQLNQVIDSIVNLEIPDVEIIVAGSYNDNDWHDVRPIAKHILTHGWTPVKKNLVAKVAQHDMLCLLHDYYLFDLDWFKKWKEFDSFNDWEIATNPQYLINGVRHFTDWVVWDHPNLPRYTSLRYDDWSHTKYQYVSGGFFLVRRDFLRAYPFDEGMQPGSAEDVEWSLRVRNKAVMICNPLAKVTHNKVHRDVGKTGFPFIQP